MTDKQKTESNVDPVSSVEDENKDSLSEKKEASIAQEESLSASQESSMEEQKEALVDEDKQSETTEPTAEKPALESEAEVKEPAETVKTEKNAKRKSAKASRATQPSNDTAASVVVKRRPYGFLFLLFIISIVSGAGAYVVWQGQQELQEKQLVVEELSTRLQATETQLAQQMEKLQAEQAQASTQLKQSVDQQVGQINAVVNDLDKRVIAQNKRLRSMSTTSREDWLLAEAEYLLKLANQRVLIEKNAEGAAALLTEADAILRDLGDPDLFAIRRAVKKDLAELRLTAKIDVEGIYLSLVALNGQVEKLPLYPTRAQRIDALESNNDKRVQELTTLNDLPWYKRIGKSLSNFVGGTKNLIRIYDVNEPPAPLLPPEQGVYLQQNLRMMIERCQLALLREQQEVYRQSLEQAQEWLKTYYPQSNKTVSFSQQLEELKTQNIVRYLPDITDSLELLQGYIIDLHRVGDAKASPSDKQG